MVALGRLECVHYQAVMFSDAGEGQANGYNDFSANSMEEVADGDEPASWEVRQRSVGVAEDWAACACCKLKRA